MHIERAITTHILNLSSGMPIPGIAVTLHKKSHPKTLYSAVTNQDGRITAWNQALELSTGIWELNFATSDWFKQQEQEYFFDDVALAFKIHDIHRDYHIPLLLNFYGYSTYRGS